ncbi:MAG: SH3 domain-containing protein [Clostridia bacterium]|nr:SH3 domain-containing protein [Clostridia bacterium]
MKKFVAILLMLCLLPITVLAAPNFESIDAVVANQNVSDRLILRDRPSEKGKVLGRFYSGTPVLILSEEGDFCEVKVGNLTGYMMRWYLEYELPNYDLPKLFYTGLVSKADAPVYDKASTSGSVIARANGQVQVLGDINDDWRYVKNGENYGYMRALHIKDVEMDIPVAYLSTRVALCSDKKLTKETGAVYAGGTVVRVLDASRSGYWARVQVLGVPGATAGPMTEGYISQDYLNVFIWPWQQTQASYAVGRLTQAISLPSVNYDGGQVQAEENTLVTILGETETKYHILFDWGQGMVDKAIVQRYTGRSAGNGGITHWGYALLSPEDERRWEHSATSRIQGYTIGTRMQVEWGYNQIDFLDAENTIILTDKDLKKYLPDLPEGAFEITDKNTAIWHFTVKEGNTATLSMENEAWNIHIENQQFGPGSYSYHLPSGTKGNLQGAAWCSDKALTPDLKLYTLRSEWAAEPAFTGSARYFCDWQIASHGSWYGYRAVPMENCDESYFIISDLNTLQEEDAAGRYVDLNGLTYEEENCFHLLPGQFIELHNCILYYDFGNG